MQKIQTFSGFLLLYLGIRNLMLAAAFELNINWTLNPALKLGCQLLTALACISMNLKIGRCSASRLAGAVPVPRG